MKDQHQRHILQGLVAGRQVALVGSVRPVNADGVLIGVALARIAFWRHSKIGLHRILKLPSLRCTLTLLPLVNLLALAASRVALLFLLLHLAHVCLPSVVSRLVTRRSRVGASVVICRRKWA